MDVAVRTRAVRGSSVLTALAVVVVLVAAVLASGGSPGPASLVALTLGLAIAYRPVESWLDRRQGLDADPDEAVRQLALAVARYSAPADALHEMAAVVSTALEARAVVVWLGDSDPLSPVVVEPPGAHAGQVPQLDPLRALDLASDDHVLAVPIVHGAETLGAVTIDLGRPPRSFDIEVAAELSVAASIIARTLVLRRTIDHRIELARDQRERLVVARRAVEHAELHERRRIERDLHDTCQQRAVALGLRLGVLASGSVTDPHEIDRSIDAALEDVAEVRASIDRTLRGVIVSRALDDGVAAALLGELASVPLATDVIDESSSRWDPEVERQVFACCLEAALNAMKHAEARRITVRLSDDDGRAMFRVIDDGVGFDVRTGSVGAGLANMRERMAMISGSLAIRSGDGGTAVVGWAPRGVAR